MTLLRDRRRELVLQDDCTMQVVSVEHDECGVERATFLVKMPDFTSPDSELWVAVFSCDLPHFADDVHEITSCCFPRMDGSASSALWRTVKELLKALQKDAKSVQLNEEFVFFPDYSANLAKIIGEVTVPSDPKEGDASSGKSSRTSSGDNSDERITVKIPLHARRLVCRLAQWLRRTPNPDPVLIVPSSEKTTGHLLHLPNHPSFIYAWDGADFGFGLHFLQETNNLIVVQGRDNLGPRITIHHPPRRGLLALTPNIQVKYLLTPAIAYPQNLISPLLEMPLPKSPTTPLLFDDILTLVKTIHECFVYSEGARPMRKSLCTSKPTESRVSREGDRVEQLVESVENLSLRHVFAQGDKPAAQSALPQQAGAAPKSVVKADLAPAPGPAPPPPPTHPVCGHQDAAQRLALSPASTSALMSYLPRTTAQAPAQTRRDPE